MDRPYRHDSGRALTSKISYIEKTDQTISQRWKKNHIVSLITDQDEGEVKGESNSLRSHAAANKNWTFYSRLIREHGPLQIWWAGSEHLNYVSSEKLSPHLKVIVVIRVHFVARQMIGLYMGCRQKFHLNLVTF